MSRRKPELGTAHVLHWLRAEGSPRLALSLVKEELRRTGRTPVVLSLVKDDQHSIEPAFRELGVPVEYIGWNRDFGKLIQRMNEATAEHDRPQPIRQIASELAARRQHFRELGSAAELGNAADRFIRLNLVFIACPELRLDK